MRCRPKHVTWLELGAVDVEGESLLETRAASFAEHLWASSVIGLSSIPCTQQCAQVDRDPSDRSVCIRPPIRLRASKIVTETPRRASVAAAASPAIPAPITTTFSSRRVRGDPARTGIVRANRFPPAFAGIIDASP